MDILRSLIISIAKILIPRLLRLLRNVYLLLNVLILRDINIVVILRVRWIFNTLLRCIHIVIVFLFNVILIRNSIFIGTINRTFRSLTYVFLINSICIVPFYRSITLIAFIKILLIFIFTYSFFNKIHEIC